MARERKSDKSNFRDFRGHEGSGISECRNVGILFTAQLAHGASVGSQHVRRFSLKLSRSCMSSREISKSKTSAFSRIRRRLDDLGITTNWCCNAQRMRICAVDLISERRDSVSTRGNRDREAVRCGPAFGYLLATATSFGSFSRAPLVKGL